MSKKARLHFVIVFFFYKGVNVILLNYYSISLVFTITLLIILFNINSFIFALILITHTFIICIGFFNSLKQKVITIDLVYWIFNYLFFIIAVILQSKEVYLPNKFPVDSNELIFGQILVILWNLIYILTRKKNKNIANISLNFHIDKNISYLYFIISTIIILIVFMNFGVPYFFGSGTIGGNFSEPLILLVNTAINGIVFANFIFLFSNRKKSNLIIKILISISFIELLYINSPFNTNRFYLGFLIIFFIWYFYKHVITAYKFSFIFLFGILIVFPILDVFRYGYSNEVKFDLKSGIEQFNQLHFDAFANFLASIEYVDNYGIIMGDNILGSMLFFIPRSIWIEKPQDSGTRIGDYLIENYGLQFNNLSNPLVSEFYLAFGIIGIIIGALVFAKIVNKIEEVVTGNLIVELLYGILLSYLFILLRGSLTVAVSSIIGSIIFIVFIPYMLTKGETLKKINL